MTTLNEAWAQYEKYLATVRADEAERRAQIKKYMAEREAHMAALHTCEQPRVFQIGACAPMSDYHESAARGWSTD